MRPPPRREAECVSHSGAMHAIAGVGQVSLSRGGAAAKSLFSGSTKVARDVAVGHPLRTAGIYGCRFSPDERTLYFIADKYGTSTGL